MSAFFFLFYPPPIFKFLNSLNIPLVLKTFILFVTVALLSFLSPVNCRSRKVEGSFMHKVNYDWDLHSFGLLCSVDWKLFIDILGHCIGPVFKGQALLKKHQKQTLYTV